MVRYSERFRGQLRRTNGKLVANSSRRLDRLLRSLRTGKQRKMDRRLLKLLAKVSDHFGGRTIVVVSGYRPYSPKQYTGNSRHNHGKAIDFRVLGVPNESLYRYCRRFAKVGCGYYPNSSFVHMDVRRLKTRWTDFSGPGQAPRYAHKRKRYAKKRKTAPPKSARRPTSPRAVIIPPRRVAKSAQSAPPKQASTGANATAAPRPAPPSVARSSKKPLTRPPRKGRPR